MIPAWRHGYGIDTFSQRVDKSGLLDISQRDVDGIDMFPGRVEMVRSFRMAIMPEVETRFSVVADQAAEEED